MTNEEIAEIIDRAGAYMQRVGWCKGDYQDQQGRVCALGALAAVVCGDPEGFSLVGREPFHQPTQALAAYLARDETRGAWCDVTSWNDAQDNPDIVIKTLHAVAAELRSES